VTTPLEACGKPYFFKVSNGDNINLQLPAPKREVSARLWVRSLSEMQKEALIRVSDSDTVWRLCSDEGPYLAGADLAPCPLAFLTTGMISSYMNEIQALARLRGIGLNKITLVQDNYYTMDGSALKGTMVGGALPVELEVQIDSEADTGDLNKLVRDAIAASPFDGLMRGQHDSLFSLSHNGRELPLGAVMKLDRPIDPDPGDQFESADPAPDTVDGKLIEKIVEAKDAHNAEALAAAKNSSLNESQKRRLQVRGTCTVRADGVKEIVQQLFNPKGSTFRFLSEESPAGGGQGRAPDAISYISAGIGFCFMTQFGRYAQIVKKDLKDYRIVQDMHFGKGGASGGTGNAGEAEPVETHVYLRSSEDDDFARTILDMAEKTCFLHAFCRTELKTRYRITRI